MLVQIYQLIHSLLVTQFLKFLQVHDFYSGKSAVETAYQFYLKRQELLSEASFNFHKCESKSADLKVLVNSKIRDAHINNKDPWYKLG